MTPLNEECGLIEWVDNLRTLRELVIKLLRERGITPNVWQFSLLETLYVLISFFLFFFPLQYNEIKRYLDEACSDMSKLSLYTTKVLVK